MKTLTILIPVFNEERTIDVILTQVVASKITGWKKEILIIDDGSTDGTKKKLKRWKKKATIIHKQKNEGKGSAVCVGLSIAHGDILLIQDADLEYSPSEYSKLLTPFGNPQVDIVYGSRFLGPHTATKFVYYLGNRFITLVTQILFDTNISDSETGYKVFRRSVVKNMTFHSKKFNFDQEFTAKVLKHGYRILEIPICYVGRNHKEGKKLTWRDGITALVTLLRYRVSD